MKTKKVPLRMCLGCGQMLPKREMLRVVKNKEGVISLDFTGRAAGRGAYVCKKAECLKNTMKQKRLERAFGAAIPQEVYDRLLEEFERGEG